MREPLGRLATARVIRAKGSLTLVHGDGSASRLEGDSAELAEAVLAFFVRARSRGEVVAYVGALSDGPFEESIVDDLLALFVRAGVLGSAPIARGDARESGAREGSTREGSTREGSTREGSTRQGGAPAGDGRVAGAKRRVVLGVTGAIQAAETPRMVGLLQQRGFEVRVVATKASRRFVSLDALTALTHHTVPVGLWGGAQSPAVHIALAEWADVVLVYPASATTLSRIARGDFSDVVSAVAIATRAPVMLVPSMNERMLSAPSVERNLACLRDDGFLVVEPAWGVEVADPPQARALRAGAALAPERVIDLVAIALSSGAERRRVERTDWDRVYQEDAAALSWAAEQMPDDLAAELAALPPPRSLLDVGTGLGTVAIHAAERGYRVVATDVSRTAIVRARERAGDLPITFVRDDITEPRVSGVFDVAVDRGSMHVLAEGELAAYATSLADLVRPGGALLLVTDGHDARRERRTLRFSPAELGSLLPGFALERAASTTLVESDPGTAWLTVWTRRS